jgi:hypothetical protein
VEVHAGDREVILAAADREPEDETAAREVVEGCGLLASSAALARLGAIRMLVVSRIRSVTAAAAASAISGS